MTCARDIKLVAADVFVASPVLSPTSRSLTDLDPWGQNYRYARHNEYAGLVYSYGPNSKDDAGAADDVSESLLWSPTGLNLPKKPKPPKKPRPPRKK